MPLRIIAIQCACIGMMLLAAWGGYQIWRQKQLHFFWKGDTQKPIIALTFDDGPKPSVTPKILEILRKFHIKATFFVVGRDCLLYPELLKQMASEGHDLQNHSYTHLRMDTLPPDQLRCEMMATNRLIQEASGQTPKWFRPPGGRYSQLVVDAAKSEGMSMGMWSVNAGDYRLAQDKGMPHMTNASLITTMAHSITHRIHNGDIVLMHNTGGDTLAMLPLVIGTLKKKGYHFVTFSKIAAHD